MMDCAKFGNMFVNGNGVISQDLLDKSHEHWGKTFLKSDTFTPGYGLGWDSVSLFSTVADLGADAFCKGGATSQFGSELIIAPKYKLSASISNVYGYKKRPEDVLCELCAIVLEELKIADVRKPANPPVAGVPVPQDIRELVEGHYYSAMGGLIKVEVKDDELVTTVFMGGDKWVENPMLPRCKYDGSRFLAIETGLETAFEEAKGTVYKIGRASCRERVLRLG